MSWTTDTLESQRQPCDDDVPLLALEGLRQMAALIEQIRREAHSLATEGSGASGSPSGGGYHAGRRPDRP
jgi:hypothetical protein